MNLSLPLRSSLALLTLYMATACVDQSIDYSEETISKRVKVEVNDLKLNFGTTERIPLSEFVKVTDYLRTDESLLYYIVKEDSTEVNIKIDPFRARVNTSRMHISGNIASTIAPNLGSSITLPPTVSSQFASFSDSHQLDFAPIDNPDIAEVSAVTFEPGSKFSFDLEVRTSNERNNIGNQLAIYEIRNVVITLPDYIVSPDLDAQHQYHVPNQSFASGTQRISIRNIRIDGLRFAQALKRGEALNGSFSIQGEARVGTKSAVTLTAAPEAYLDLVVRANDTESTKIQAKSVTGIFTPELTQDHKRFEIKSSLPEGLETSKISLQVARPTLAVTLDMKDIPVSAQLHNAQLYTVTGDKRDLITFAPEPILLTHHTLNQVYIYDGSAPYSPTPISPTAQLSTVSGLSKLLTQVPDELEMNLGREALSLAGQTSTITFDKVYSAQIHYTLYVPFLFDKGFSLEYSGKSREIKLDLEQDIEDGQISIEVRSNILSTLPLSLSGSVVPCDKDDNVIPSVTSSIASIPASANGEPVIAPFDVRITAQSNELLKKLHHIRFTVTTNSADAANASALRSNQYIQIKDARLYLSGSATTDLNKIKL